MISNQNRSQVVAFGGGHGLYAMLRAIGHLTDSITAVVTVADDGGSSGRIRKEFGCLPPGDIRMALCALCESSPSGEIWEQILQYRFSSEGPINGHALGNLFLLAMREVLADEVEALNVAIRLLGVRGKVLPMAIEPLTIEAEVSGQAGATFTVKGQVACAKTRYPIVDLKITPAQAEIHPEVITKISESDYLIFGPGSWYTSVIPHLVHPKLRRAICGSKAEKILCLNLEPQNGETSGMSCADLVSVVHRFAPEIKFSWVLADPLSVESIEQLEKQAAKISARVLYRQVRVSGDKPIHDPMRLAGALRDIFDQVYGDVPT